MDRRPGPNSRRGELSQGAEAFEKGIQSGSQDEEQLQRLAKWARALEREGLARLFSFRGTTGRMTLLPYLWNEEAGLVTVWDDNGASLQVWKIVFERRAPNSIARVEEKFGGRIGQGNTTRDISGSLLEAVADAYRETRPSSE